MYRDQETVYAIVEKLEHFEIAKTVCESTTHIVCGGPRRTVNILAGTAKGCWILSLEWVRSSVCIKRALCSVPLSACLCICVCDVCVVCCVNVLC